MKTGEGIYSLCALKLFSPEGKNRILALFTMVFDIISGGKIYSGKGNFRTSRI